MEQILPTNEYTEVEGKVYVNPQTGIDETNTFIENLRATQGQQNQEIAEQTYNLGTAVPSVQGGLGAPTDTGLAYFTSRYQTPQTSANVANLRAVNQAKALNDALVNDQAVWKERYSQAYRNYQKRARARARASASSGGGNNPTTEIKGGLDYNDTGETKTGLRAEQDINKYGIKSTVYDSTEVAHDNRSTERNKKIEVTKDKKGNVTTITVNGVPHYGRDARATYRNLKNSGLVR